MRLFISVVLFTLFGTLSASPLRLATRDDRGLAIAKRAPGSPANENAAPATGSNEKPIEDSLEKNRRNWRKLNYFNDDVYEVVDFGNPPQTALVKVFRGSYSDFQKDQVQQLAKLGVLLKEAYNPFTSTYYIAIKKVGKFASEFDPKEKPDTAHLIRKAQETCDIKLQTQGDYYKAYTFDEDGAHPTFRAIIDTRIETRIKLPKPEVFSKEIKDILPMPGQAS